MAWTDRTGGDDRKEKAETPADRVKRVLKEKVGGEHIMGVQYVSYKQQPTYELSTSRKHHSISPDDLPLVTRLIEQGLKRGKDFDVSQSAQAISPNIFTVVVQRDALERVAGGTVDRDSVLDTLRLGKDHLSGIKKVPGGLNGAYIINTSVKVPGTPPEDCKLAVHFKGMGMFPGENFRAEGDGERGVVVTVRQAALEERFPETRMPARTPSATD